MEEFVERLARGNVTEVKVVLASVVMALACYQVALMAVGYGKLRLPFLASRPASAAHRAIGDSIAALAIVIAIMCLSVFEMDEDGLHAAFGAGVLLVLAVKIAVVRRWLPGDRFLPLLGTAVLLLFAGAWATAAAEYLL